MIGRLSGLFVDAEGDDAVIDVAGVGYLVRCGARTLSRLPPLGEPVVLQIESQTREDGTRLFGFLSKSDRAAFVAVLDILPPAELAAAVVRDDRAAVARASGVGPKLAQRIVTELKGKPLVAGLSIGPDVSGPAPSASPVVRVSGEAVAALLGLGIAESAARRAVETAEQRLGPDPALSALIKAALQEVGR